ncbi:hypothetical protein ACFUI7_26895, partial [Streptomyces sp. NPDC057241]
DEAAHDAADDASHDAADHAADDTPHAPDPDASPPGRRPRAAPAGPPPPAGVVTGAWTAARSYDSVTRTVEGLAP